MATKKVNLIASIEKTAPFLMDRFTFADVENYHLGKENQIYSKHTKSGKHYIYAHFEKDTKELFYIGLGKYNRCNQISQRNKYWKFVKNKHGVIIRLLETDLTLEEAIEKEVYYITKYQPKTNMTIGGDAGNTENLRIKVYAYFKDGKFFNSFNSISDANIFFNARENDSRINRCLKGDRKSFAGYIWKKEYLKSVEPYKKKKIHNQKSVYRYDIDGNFIEKLEKVTDFKEGGHTGISNTIDKNLTYYNSFWRSVYKERIEVQKIIPALKPSKKVLNIETKEIFDSISKASKTVKYCRSVLERKLNGKIKNNTNLQWLKT